MYLGSVFLPSQTISVHSLGSIPRERRRAARLGRVFRLMRRHRPPIQAVPHIARLVWKTADHRILIPAVMLLGATGLLISDMISQLPGSDKILPINSITALLGIPVVVWIVVRNRRFARIS